MILIPEQISYLREKRGTILNNLATYKDYLKNKEVVSSDYSARAYIGDSLTDEQFHRERQNLREVQETLENSEYLRERNFDQVSIGTKFIVKFDGTEETESLILTEGLFGLAIDGGFISITSPLGQHIIGKHPGQKFSYSIQNGSRTFDKRIVSGTILEIIRDPKEYVHFLTERPKSQRISKPEKRKLHALLSDESELAKEELASYHTITPSQEYMLRLEAARLTGKRDTASIARLAIVNELLSRKVVAREDDSTIGIGSKFDVTICSPDSTITTHTYEMINSAVSDELDDAYVERISPIGESLYGLHEKDTFKFRRDNKTYTGVVDHIHQTKKSENEYSTPLQYRKK